MQYKTIVLELLQLNSELHSNLVSSNSLTSTLNQLAIQLRENHLAIMEEIRQAHPNSSEHQLKSEAMEIAVETLQNLLSKTPQEVESAKSILDDAMNYLRRQAPPS
jgi:hypothetical protein